MIMIVETPQVGSLAAEDKGEAVGGRGLRWVGIVAPSRWRAGEEENEASRISSFKSAWQ